MLSRCVKVIAFTHPPSCLNNKGQRGEGKVQAAHSAATTDEDAVGVYCGSNLGGTSSGHAVEARNGECRAVAHGE
jgi:hypothetical protein